MSPLNFQYVWSKLTSMCHVLFIGCAVIWFLLQGKLSLLLDIFDGGELLSQINNLFYHCRKKLLQIAIDTWVIYRIFDIFDGGELSIQISNLFYHFRKSYWEYAIAVKRIRQIRERYIEFSEIMSSGKRRLWGEICMPQTFSATVASVLGSTFICEQTYSCLSINKSQERSLLTWELSHENLYQPSCARF